MREISAIKIKEAVTELAGRANFFLRKDVIIALRKAYALEKNKRAKEFLKPYWITRLSPPKKSWPSARIPAWG